MSEDITDEKEEETKAVNQPAEVKDQGKAPEGTPKEAAPASAKDAPGKEKKPEAAKKQDSAGKGDSDTTEDSGDGGEGSKKEKKPQTAEDVFLALEGDEEKPKVLKAKGSKNVRNGIVHIQSSYNNTKVSVTDLNGNAIGWSSSGKLGFRGSRKSTSYAAQLVSQDACRQAMGHGLKSVEVRVKGPGAGRESAVRAVQNLGIEVTLIRDVTPVPHNGCRPKKPRRV